MIERISIHGQHPNDVHLPEGALYVGRPYGGTKGHFLGNPHAVGKPCRAGSYCKSPDCPPCRPCDDGHAVHTEAEALALYREHIEFHPRMLTVAANLAALHTAFACRCALDQACHVDVLIELIERETAGVHYLNRPFTGSASYVTTDRTAA